MMAEQRQTCEVLGTPIDVVSWDAVLRRIDTWAAQRASRYVCIVNVHSVVTASRDAGYARILRGADLASPDGAPVAWMLRRLGHPEQRRIAGPDLMERYCEHAARGGHSVFLLGGTPETLARLLEVLHERFAGLRIAGAESPPFRPLTAEEDRAVVERINASGAGVVFVSLGCPKQETWMAAHRGSVQAVMIGFGAAFDFHAGSVARAPQWMRTAGLEWLHRLASEPRRLWRRYLVTNTLFICKATVQLLAGRRQP